ncbi:aspartic peptidase domain-containing protein [Myxozyma melibiosi]|uniref:Aspartic peptidase domain-containing protein n=1 Tax=Myxozyma melibiosi TaxID=54550 RepID=A0ABR1FFU5_9ASCO
MPGTLSIGFERNLLAADSVHASLHKRDGDGTAGEVIYNQQKYYVAPVRVGTPPQELRLAIDTGSSDIWFLSDLNEFCLAEEDPCSESGLFNFTASSTIVSDLDEFSITYGDNTQADGVYAQDTLEIAGVTLTNQTLAVATDTNLTNGVLGIGYESGEVSAGDNSSTTGQYSGLLRSMVDQGYINSRVYSLYLNDLDAPTGDVLFGGINRAKYDGDLVVLPIQKEDGQTNHTRFLVTLEGVEIGDGTDIQVLDDSLDTPALIDSGTTFTYLPSDIVDEVVNATGAIYEPALGVYVQSCTLRELNVSVNFKFENVTIKTPIKDLYSPLTYSNGSAVVADGYELCQITMQPASSMVILGDTFLSSAYAVFDLDNNVIGLAQSKLNSTESDIVAVDAGSNAILDALTKPAASATVSHSSATASASASSSSGIAASSSAISSSSSSSSSTSSAASSSSSGAAAAGLRPAAAAENGVFGSLGIIFAVTFWLV